MFHLCVASQKLFGTAYFLPLVLFLTFANLFIFFEDRLLRQERYAAIITDNVAQVIDHEDKVPRTEHIDIQGDLIHVSPVEEGSLTYQDVSCIYIFVILTAADVLPILPPDARTYDKFSWRMIQRQYYALNRANLPFGVNLYFVLEKPDIEGLRILEEENKVFADLLYQESGEDYGKKIMSFVEIDSAQCDGWLMTDKESVIDMTQIDELNESIRSNEMICPRARDCSNPGTLIRLELYKDLKFGGKGPGRVLNQRAEQCRRVEYHEYMRRHVNFEQFKEREFERPFPLKPEPMLPPAFVGDLDELNAKIGISLMPRIPCSNHTMATFVKTGRQNRKARDLVRTMAQLHRGIQPYFILGTGSDNVDIGAESEEYGDIVIGDFADIYENLPLKTMLGYQFAADHCRGVDFFFYQDDDIFMKFDAFFQAQDLNRNSPFMICPMGGAAGRAEHTRTNYFRKHYAPIELLPPEYRIVPYCNGPCVFMSAEALGQLYDTARRTDRHGFRIEDMYFNGIIRIKADIDIRTTKPLKGQKRFCEHILSGDKNAIIRQKLKSYNSKLILPPN